LALYLAVQGFLFAKQNFLIVLEMEIKFAIGDVFHIHLPAACLVSPALNGWRPDHAFKEFLFFPSSGSHRRQGNFGLYAYATSGEPVPYQPDKESCEASRAGLLEYRLQARLFSA